MFTPLRKRLTLSQIATFFLYLSCIALSFKALREPDIWWMYRTGEWMIDQGTVTFNDPFSYTFYGVEWINVKWFFEILITINRWIWGPEGVFMIQAVVSSFVLYLVLKSSHIILETKVLSAFVAVGFLFLLGMDFRMIGRPEMVSHLMTALYLYLMVRSRQKPNLIYGFIPLQILWTNLHEAYGIGLVLICTFLGAETVLSILKKSAKKEWSRPLIVLVVSILAIAINPRGLYMIIHPFEIFGQLSSNQYTTELAPISSSLYWEKEAYLFLVFSSSFLLVIGYIIWKQLKEKTSIITSLQTIHQSYPLGWVTSCLLLVYLGTTSYRNIPFSLIATFPFFVLFLHFVIAKLPAQTWLNRVLQVLPVLLYISILSGFFHTNYNKRDRYGLQTLSSHNPIGASSFLHQHNISGRCFSDYLTSSYLLWDHRPGFQTYIDLRDLDIFTNEFFQDFTQMTIIPSQFDNIDDSLNFNHVVLFRPQFPALHMHLLQSPKYDLVFADPVACVYLKNNDQNADLISQYGFVKNNTYDLFSPLVKIPSSSLCSWASMIINPFYAETDYSTINQDAIAASFYMTINSFENVYQRGLSASRSKHEPEKGHEILGNMYNTLAFLPETTDSLRSQYKQQAFIQYDYALQINKEMSSAKIGKALVFMQEGNLIAGITLLDEVLTNDNGNMDALRYMSMAYKNLCMSSPQQQNASKWLIYAKRIYENNPDNPFSILDLGLAYCMMNDCSNALFYLNKIINKTGLSPVDMKIAQKCLDKCQ